MKGRQSRVRRSLTILSVLVLCVTYAATVWGSTRIGNAELQMWYRTRNTFQSSGGDHLNWVQWRNEVFFWFVYDKFVDNGKILGQDKLEIPFVENATLNARYRFRADPVWTIREAYKKRYDRHERKSYLFPENGFRDLFVDLDFGEVGLGRLSTRIGYQQIVWGESDLYRSIDVINPLRVDQNQGAGEKFDEFRLPIFAFKGNYNIGNVGSWFSNVYLEPFVSPGYRTGLSHLIIDGGAARAPFHLKGCLDNNNNLIPYSAKACGSARTGDPVLVPWNPSWKSRAGSRHPWAFINRSQNPRGGTPDFGNGSDSPDIAGTRFSYLPQAYKGLCKGRGLRGMWSDCTTAAGIRIFGTSVGGFDFSLNYANIPQGINGTFDLSDVAAAPVYGDPAIAQRLKLGTPVGTLEEGLRRCFDDKGRGHRPVNDASQGRGKVNSTVVLADINGYNNPARFGPKGALLPNGDAKPGRHGALRDPRTLCGVANRYYHRNNIIGFTATYNDFDYTGAIFRLEQSFSTKENTRHLPVGTGRINDLKGDAAAKNTAFSINKNYHSYTPMWRSMIGFDLLKSVPSFRYIPFLHHSFADQAWFFTGQWLMQNQWSRVANPLCYVVDNAGNGLTKQEAQALSAKDGKRHYSNAQCRYYRWNHLLTLAAANQGLFASRVETRNAVVFEPRAKDWLLFSQWWWRNVLGYENVELSLGVAWYPGSSMSQGWSGIYSVADRDQFWFEFTYYLL